MFIYFFFFIILFIRYHLAQMFLHYFCLYKFGIIGEICKTIETIRTYLTKVGNKLKNANAKSGTVYAENHGSRKLLKHLSFQFNFAIRGNNQLHFFQFYLSFLCNKTSQGFAVDVFRLHGGFMVIDQTTATVYGGVVSTFTQMLL